MGLNDNMLTPVARSNQTTNEDGSVDPYLVTMQRDLNKKLYKREAGHNGIKIKRQSHADNWHTDSSFEVGCCQHLLEEGVGV